MKNGILIMVCVCALIYQAFGNFSTSIPISEMTYTHSASSVSFHARSFDYEPGFPQLPVETYMILLPPDADLSTVAAGFTCSSENLSTITAEIPAAAPLYADDQVYEWPRSLTVRDGKVQEVYTKDQFYPKSPVEILTVGTMHSFKLVQVRVFPCLYNPVQGTLKTFNNGSVSITASSLKEYSPPHYQVPAHLLKIVQRNCINYNQIAAEYEQQMRFTGKITYLIVADKSVKDASKKLNDFIASKQARGYEVKVITESDWGAGTGNTAADNLRNWLKKNYQEMKIGYVLLMGNPLPTGTIPMRVDGKNAPTDMCYRDLSGDYPNKEFLPDICVGRIPVYDNNGVTALDKILEKTIAYENQSPTEITAWRKNALFAAKPFKEKVADGSELFEELKKKCVDPMQWKCYRIYSNTLGSPDESSCTQAAVVKAWKAKPYGIMEWHTHGMDKSASSVMSTADTKNLNEKPAFVHMGSCLNGKIQTTTNLQYAMLIDQAIGTVGATVTTWYENYVGDVENHSTIQGFVFMTGNGLMKDSSNIGTALLEGVVKCDKKQEDNMRAFNIYGDPEVGIYSAKGLTAIMPSLSEAALQNREFKLIASSHLKSNQIRIQGFVPKGSYKITVYDLMGKEITILAQTQESKGSLQSFLWNGCDKNGSTCGKGFYVIKIQHPELSRSILAPLM